MAVLSSARRRRRRGRGWMVAAAAAAAMAAAVALRPRPVTRPPDARREVPRAGRPAAVAPPAAPTAPPAAGAPTPSPAPVRTVTASVTVVLSEEEERPAAALQERRVAVPTPTPAPEECVTLRRAGGGQSLAAPGNVLVEVELANRCGRDLDPLEVWVWVGGYRQGALVQAVEGHPFARLRRGGSVEVVLALPGSADWYDRIEARVVPPP